ncbi:MAG: hypothetical protein GTO45_14720 [Candidatus Aminicenantes bacterium]|nr:hypothetical protein [Candidatus Aminicenantes bacterium]NIM80007.1 hypothetical protein [Candidatus Aminicenantes bacterium]NIN19361.1 hypothetical protein [Candidatus Aminicenantes bacterium]NIN43260.1 hypothetical protein [Candidatus Aminicenantes bacterium]NIN86002.1 hypothetical protein [Candidatus Aminicenantes bacterium]
MKRKHLILFALLAFLSLHLVGKNFSIQLDVTSRFIWRGFDLLPNNNPAFQPSLTYDFGSTGFSLNLWASFALSDRGIYKYADEIDLTLTYTFKTPENVSLVLGFTNYGYWFAENFKFKENTSQEFFVEVGFPRVPFSPSVTAFYDINLFDGLYVQLKGEKPVSIGDKISLNLSAALGYNAGLYLPEGADTGFSDLTIGASIPFKIGKTTLLSPFVNYTFVFLDAVNDDNELWFGVSLIF